MRCDGRSMRLTAAAALTAAFLGGVVDESHAGVEGAEIVSGDVTIAQNGNQIVITASDGSIIQFDAFNVGLNEIVQFVQPHDLARVLNRITGNEPTLIQGTLMANGFVYFVNPAGVVFGDMATVDVAGLYAAAGDLSNADFLNNNNLFTNLQGTVRNDGTIRASEVYLVGEQVANHGSIQASRGIVAMVAGNDVMLRRHGDRITVVIDGAAFDPNDGPKGGVTNVELTATPGVENTGSISADRGHVMLGAGDHYALAIRNTGEISVGEGRIDALAGDGLVHNAGVMSADVDTGTAGTIVVQGPNVLNEGTLSASADDGRAGYVELTSRYRTYLGAGSEINAGGGTGHADGGEILVHSYDGRTTMLGGARVDVSAGDAGGDGGFVELSAAGVLSVHGDVDASGHTTGADGEVLLDPRNILIAQFGLPPAGVLDPDGNGNVTYEFGEPGNLPNEDSVIGVQFLEAIQGEIRLEATGSIFVNFVLNLLNNNDVVLLANNDINVNAAINGANSLTLRADNDDSGVGALSIAVPLSVTDFVDFSGTQIVLADPSAGGGLIESGGDQFYSAPIELGNAYTLSSGGTTTFGGTIDGAFDLSVNATEMAIFRGDIGALTPVQSLAVSADQIMFDDGTPINESQNGAIAVFAEEDIAFNPNGRTEVPQTATIGATGDFSVESLNGDVVIGPLEKLTAIGDLSITAANEAVIGDLSAFGDLSVEADTITINARPAGEVLNADGTTTMDDGTDIVATGTVNFSVAPTIVGDGSVSIAAPDDSIGDELDGVTQFIREGVVRSDFTIGETDVMLLDLAANGGMSSPAQDGFATIIDEQVAVETPVFRDAIALRPLARLSLYLNEDDPSEVVGTVAGSRLYETLPDTLTPGASDRRMAVQRLRRDALLRAIEIHDKMFLSEGVADDVAQRQDEYIRTVLERAYESYRERQDEYGDFRAYVESQTSAFGEALVYLNGLRDYFNAVVVMGATPAELRASANGVLEPIQPSGMTRDQFEQAIGGKGFPAPVDDEFAG